MIKTEGLAKRFDGNLAVEDLSLHVQRGEVFAFLGPNGAGKTTTVRMLTAPIAPTAGRAWVNGHEIGQNDMDIQRSVGILTESPGLYERLKRMNDPRAAQQVTGIFVIPIVGLSLVVLAGSGPPTAGWHRPSRRICLGCTW